jgi:hypothetical protein
MKYKKIATKLPISCGFFSSSSNFYGIVTSACSNTEITSEIMNFIDNWKDSLDEGSAHRKASDTGQYKEEKTSSGKERERERRKKWGSSERHYILGE